jgi:predicted nucleic acid-binding protein
MAGSYVLDTNVVISLLGNDPGVKAQLEASERVGIPAIVIGELYYGACRSGQVQANCEKIKQLTREIAVLDCDAAWQNVSGWRAELCDAAWCRLVATGLLACRRYRSRRSSTLQGN